MASAKVAVLVAIVCFLLQSVDSRSFLSKLRESNLPPKAGWKLGRINRLSINGLRTADLTYLDEEVAAPSFKFVKSKLEGRKPNFGGKLGGRKSFLAGTNPGSRKPAGGLSPKKDFVGKLKAGRLGKLSGFENSKKKNVYSRHLLETPKLTIDGKLTNKNSLFSNGMLGRKGLTLNENFGNEMLGLGNRYQFFDGRRGIFHRTNGIFDLKKVNPIDMLDEKLAKLNERFGSATDRIQNIFSKKNIDSANSNRFNPLIETSLLREILEEKLAEIETVFADKLDQIGNAVNGEVQENTPMIVSAGARKRSLLDGFKFGEGSSRLGGGLKLRNATRKGKGVLGDRFRVRTGPKLGRGFGLIGGPKIDSRSAEDIANVIVAGINGVAGAYNSHSSQVARDSPRRLRSIPRKRFSSKNIRNPTFQLFNGKLAQRVIQDLRKVAFTFTTPIPGRLSSLGAGKFAKAARNFGGKFATRVNRKSRASAPTFFSPEAPSASTALAPGTGSPVSEVASTAVPAGLALGDTALGDEITGVLFCIELLESGGTVEEATEALIQRNDTYALTALLYAVDQAAASMR